MLYKDLICLFFQVYKAETISNFLFIHRFIKNSFKTRPRPFLLVFHHISIIYLFSSILLFSSSRFRSFSLRNLNFNFKNYFFFLFSLSNSSNNFCAVSASNAPYSIHHFLAILLSGFCSYKLV